VIAMRVAQLSWSETAGWTAVSGDRAKADLVFFFGTRQALACGARYRELRAMFPSAHILGCSTGGQIHNDDVTDDEITAAAIGFDATNLRIACEPALAAESSRTCGGTIGRVLAAPDLVGIFVLSDGLNVNGSELVAGITGAVGEQVAVTGGLAGDGADFRETLVGANCVPRKQTVAAVGFYGSAIRIGHGSAGGWDEFGPRRQITRSRGNVLFEFDGQPALDLYELYLGDEEARGLPGSGLLFPLRIFDPERPDHDIVRTILAVDHEARSMTFAGDVPEGWTAQLMREFRPAGSRRRRGRTPGCRRHRSKPDRRSARDPRQLHRPAAADGSAHRRRTRSRERRIRTAYSTARFLLVRRNLTASLVGSLRTSQPDDDRHDDCRGAGTRRCISSLPDSLPKQPRAPAN